MTRRLGRGLADIIETTPQSSAGFVMLKTNQIHAGRFQPRMRMEEATLEELKASIKRSGVIEPVIVRPTAHGSYELVAGERRLRASQSLGIEEIPAVIKTLSDKEAVEFSLIENVQRENLNPLEEAKGYTRLLEEFGYTQEDVAAAVGRDRATIANFLRLLALPEEMQQALGEGAMTMGHAKALLGIDDRVHQRRLFERVKREHLSVRQTEALSGALAPTRRRTRHADPQLKPLEDALRRTLGTKVGVSSRKKGGRITIEYFSQEDLSRILHVLGVTIS